MEGGLQKRDRGKKKTPAKKSRASKKSAKKSAKSRKSKKSAKGMPARVSAKRPKQTGMSSRGTSKRSSLPATARDISGSPFPRQRVSRASESMQMSDLQVMAMSRGIPFGGLSKAKLIKKLNNYY